MTNREGWNIALKTLMWAMLTLLGMAITLMEGEPLGGDYYKPPPKEILISDFDGDGVENWPSSDDE